MDDSQNELNNIYNIIQSGLKSLQIFTKINNYDVSIYNSHKNTIACYQKYYIAIVSKIKEYIHKLNDIEKCIVDNRKDIRKYYDNIVELHKENIGNININFENLMKKAGRCEQCNNVIDANAILSDYQKKADLFKDAIKGFVENKCVESTDDTKHSAKDVKIEQKDVIEEKEESTEQKETSDQKDVTFI